MKKNIIRQLIKIFGVSLLILLIGQYLWNGILHDFFPWTKTNFESYKEFTCFLIEHSFSGSEQFINSFPENSSGAKYYIDQKLRKKAVAYSVVLDQNAYKTSIENQMIKHQRFIEWGADELIYIRNLNESWSVDNLAQLKMNTDFLVEVMHEPNEQQNYYCAIVVTRKETDVIIYTGVIANDTTHEMIEFCVEIPDE